MKIETLKLFRSQRTETKEPINLKIWIRNGASEFFGTIVLSLLLAGASLVVYTAMESGKPEHKDLADYLFNPIIVGFYAGFIAVGFVLIVFIRWSCDLNPAVTTYRMITGANTYRYGFYKMFIQFCAGIIAGLIIYGVGRAVNTDYEIVNKAITTSGAINKVFPKSTSQELGGLWIFFVEIVTAFVLLYSVFSKTISEKYRHVSICFVISMSVWAGIHGGSPAINPARGFAQEVPAIFFGAKYGAAQSASDVGFGALALMAGGFVAPFVYALFQDFNAQYFTPVFDKLVAYKNHNNTLMKIVGRNKSNENTSAIKKPKKS